MNGALTDYIRRVVSRLPEPRYTRLRNRKLFDWMNRVTVGKRVLNLGSGVGRFDGYLSREIKTINFDRNPKAGKLDIIGDAHFLPFRNDSLDVVYSIAVLEHVKKPWIVAEEIFRVLRSGGHVVVELPFLNVIHDDQDYFRFTDKGIRSLFDHSRFKVVFEQVGSGGGSFLSVLLLEYLEQFIPSKYLKGLWRVIMRYPLSMLKYLDRLVERSPNLRRTANSFSFIGTKR